jgi:hypothetical protein
MAELRYTLELDTSESEKIMNYFLYRSTEKGINRPLVDGLYIQRSELSENPPKYIKISLQFD